MEEEDWYEVQEEQVRYNRCKRWTDRALWYTIVGCHVYMIAKGINPYGIL
jgi:hypothetical protein